MKRTLVPLALLAIITLSTLPGGIGFSTGIHRGMQGIPDEFQENGCASSGCHSADHAFAENSYEVISWDIVAEDGTSITGNTYEHGAAYTITITLNEQNNPDAGNRAGFNLMVSAGELSTADDEDVQVSEDQMEATHTNPEQVNWTVAWTAPEEGVVVFDLFVNDVDGDGAASPTDSVHRVGWYLTDAGEVPGAAAEEEHFEVGVPLPQYWLGLIALFGMAVIIVFGFVYLKWFSPHHADQKKR